jgi:hypothetical protein
MTKPKKRNDDDFYAGMIAALAVIALHDSEVIFREIVATADEDALVDFAKRDDAMEFSGLARYGYGDKKGNPR